MSRLILKRLRSERKRRPFACACLRGAWDRLEDGRSKKAVEVAEAFADGRATKEELGAAWGAAWIAAIDARVAAWVVPSAARTAASAEALEAPGAPPVSAWPIARQKQALLLDDIAGPDHLPDLPRTLLTVNLAQAIYGLRRWQDMPVIGDALEEAGCTDAGILSHLRGPGPHVLGCHVLDLILNKE
jgi:hypothetical protein